MPFHYLAHLSSDRRDGRADRHLGCALAFVAGAVNAGGFLAIGGYTSHMTGIVSSMADDLALGNLSLALAALAAWLAFVAGAASTALMVNWARRRRLHSQYALSLMVEAALLLLFGLAGTHLAGMDDVLAPVTVLLLCYIMGLQNAIITKASGATIRTTHLTGLSTDVGIELGKLAYVNRRPLDMPAVRVNRAKLTLHALLIGFFFGGGVTGALGFKHVGFSATLVLAVLLALLAAGPIVHDLRLRWRFHRLRSEHLPDGDGPGGAAAPPG